jgi:hypothetical protein
MPGTPMTRLGGLLFAASLLASSTAASAAGTVNAPQQINPWATLTLLSGGAPAAAICGAAAASAAAQPTTGCVLPVMDAPPPPVASAPPPPPPPLPVAAAGYGVAPLLLGLVAIAGAVGLFFAVHGHSHANAPVSPA